MNPGLDKVLAAAEQSPSKVAARLDSDDRPCLRQHVEYWIKQGYVPPSWAPLVSQEFGVPLHELNERVYPTPPRRAHARH